MKKSINTGKAFNWSQYWDFRELKESAILLCDEILSFDDSVCSSELQYCADTFKGMALKTKAFFAVISEECEKETITLWTNDLSREIELGMDYATVFLILGDIAFLNENNTEHAVIEQFCAQIKDSALYRDLGSPYADVDSSGISFTNLYGTATTQCNYSECGNPIAPCGNTNCCIAHSSKCLSCGTFIDNDAMFCLSCIEEKVGNTASKYSAVNACQYTYLNGLKCDRVTNRYIDLCDEHFEQLYQSYQDLLYSIGSVLK